jgi:hypothetical protein
MTLLASRKKLITFRVTVEEYEALRQICISKRARSISELTRGAVLQQLSAETPSRAVISGDLISLVSALEQIDGAIKELSGHISKVLGPAGERPGECEAP